MKTKIFIIAILILCLVFVKDVIAIANLINQKTISNSQDLFALIIEVVFISALGLYIKQKFWRIGWCSIGTSVLLSYASSILKNNFPLFLLILAIAFVSFGGFMIVSSFKKPDFNIKAISKSMPKINKLIVTLLVGVAVILIFLLYSIK